MTRLLACAIAIGLVVFGPAPLSVCSLLFSATTDCTTPNTHSKCDKMDMDMGTLPVETVCAQSQSCCAISQAPLPESRNNASKISPEEQLVADPTPSNVELQLVHGGINYVPVDVSPPPLRSLLCTFLI